jgi:hypothetical protein
MVKKIPTMMKSEYARSGSGPRYKTPVLGLGIVNGINSNYFLASATTPAKLVGSTRIALSICFSFR